MEINFTNKISDYFNNINRVIDSLDQSKINALLNNLIEIYKSGNSVYIMGNGGSASTASHFVCDMNQMIEGDKKRFKVISLCDNIPTILAHANDKGYETIFVEQLKNILSQGDLVIGISGSGNSKNVLLAIDYAKQKGAYTVGLCGYNGGQLKEIVDLDLTTNIDDMKLSEDIHLVIFHLSAKILSHHINNDSKGD